MVTQDYLNITDHLTIDSTKFSFYSLRKLQQQGHAISRLPFCIRVLLENAIRHFDDYVVSKDHVSTLLNWSPNPEEKEIPFMPTRVLMQDFTGVPAIVDIASLRSEMARKGKNLSRINPLIPVDLVVDHSV
jgi:aconitate hydratase